MKSVTYLVIFKLLDSFVFLALSFGLNGIGPLGYTGLADLIQFFALIKPHSSVVLFLVGLRAHTFNSFEFINAQNSRVLSY